MENEVLDELDQPVDEALLRGDEEGEQGEQQEAEEAEEKEAPTGGEQQVEAEQKPTDEDMPVVPRARFNEVNEERKALKAEVEQLRAAGQRTEQQEAAVDMKALRRQATEALLDGDMDKHDEIQDKIQGEILRQAEMQAEARMAQRAEFNDFQNKAAALAVEFPVLDANNGDPEAIGMVIELRDAYIAKGMGMTKALEAAARKVAPLFGGKQPAAESSKPDERTLKAVKRGVEASESLPPQGAGVGNRAQPPKATGQVSQADWERMTPSERERMLSAA